MNIKMLPFNQRGVIDISLVTPVAITPNGRASMPYPPGKVKVNADYWPNGATYTGTVTLSWQHRVRTAQTDRNIVHQDAASVVGAVEGTYTVEVLTAGIVRRTVTGLTGTSFAYTYAQRVADDAVTTNLTKFRITPVNGLISGPPRTTDSFQMNP
jgi:hypothetical protein